MKAILSRFVAWEALQLAFVAGGITGSLITGGFMVAVLAGMPVAHMIGGLL